MQQQRQHTGAAACIPHNAMPPFPCQPLPMCSTIHATSIAGLSCSHQNQSKSPNPNKIKPGKLLPLLLLPPHGVLPTTVVMWTMAVVTGRTLSLHPTPPHPTHLPNTPPTRSVANWTTFPHSHRTTCIVSQSHHEYVVSHCQASS